MFLGVILGSLLQLVFPFLTQSVVDVGINTQNIQFVYIILFAQLALFIGRLSVEFIRSWIKAGQELFYIIPEQPTYFAELLASQQNFGKISKGQSVNIALNSYQRNEFGILKGKIENKL